MRDNNEEVFFINDFKGIGWADPFPEDDKKGKQQAVMELPKDPRKLVYDKTRYSAVNSPYVIYYPSKDIMVKLMRACLGVTQVEDLWIHQEEI